MLRTMLKSKIHRATVTRADRHHLGSITIGSDLIEAAGPKPRVVHVDAGNRIIDLHSDPAV